MSLLGNISYRVRYVWRRNLDVSLFNWKTMVLPPLLEPMLYLFAFGVGLGAYVEKVQFHGFLTSYLTFMAPGMIAVATLFHAIFECMYGSFIRMRYQKTFDAMLTTPLLMEDILAGEILWGATKGLFAATAVLIVISLWGLASYPASLLVLPAAALAGLLFAGFGLLFAAVSPYIDNLNLPTFLFINPMFLFSGVFFPLDNLPRWLRAVAWCLPLTHVVEIMRVATFGSLRASLWGDFAYLAVLTPAVCYAAIFLMKRRLIK
jgi:lipooligosaccharide transport system permease protein